MTEINEQEQKAVLRNQCLSAAINVVMAMNAKSQLSMSDDTPKKVTDIAARFGRYVLDGTVDDEV